MSLIALHQRSKYLQAVVGLTSTLECLERLTAGEELTAPGNVPCELVDDLVASITKSAAGLCNQGRHLRAIIEAEPECVKMLDVAGNLLEMNSAGLRMIEADSFEQIRGANVSALLHPDWKEPFLKMHRAVMRGESHRLIFQLVGLKGTQRWMETHAVPLRNADGEVVHLAITHDISKRKQQELELIEAKERAEAYSASKTNFLANMSHELRTPLTAVLGYVDVLSLEDCSPEEHISSIETIRGSANHLLALISDVLDVSKVEAEMVEIECLPMNPADLICEVADSLRAQVESQGIGLTVKLEEPLAAEITTDPLRLRQILTNLLGNAIKFTRHGEVSVKLSCPPATSAGATGLASLRLSVSDTGIGIAPSAIDTLFTAFTQAESSTTRNFGGTGLGLTISQRLAVMMGGSILVESELGKGSEFTLVLEVQASMKEATCPVVQNSPPAALPKRASSAKQELPGFCARVLLVEDNTINRKVLCKLLESLGVEVEQAGDGQKCVDMARQSIQSKHPYDLILLDMHMPVMDGYEAAEILRTEHYPTPIVALTASAMDDDRGRCLAAGCDDYVTKPIRREQLHAALTRHLETTLGHPSRR
ncbi:MAG: PAS domain S-box-containing protein [Planctomycetota bacterium]|jgi:PAS domain S-box-containing protein